MSKMLPIPSYIEDPMYRYKMPPMILKVEGKGNGIKTNIVNLGEVAEALRVPAEYPLKFLGMEQGSQTTFKQTGGDLITIVNGNFQYENLKKSLDKFIEKYVLCNKCKLPEIAMSVVNKIVMGRCNACGWDGQMDNKHRLATIIIKNPPKLMQDITEGVPVEDIKIKKKEKKSSKTKEPKEEGKEKKDKKKKKEKKKPSKPYESSEEDKAIIEALKEKFKGEEGNSLTHTSELITEVTTFFREKYLEIVEDESYAKKVDDIVYSMLKKLELSSKQTIHYGFIIFNSVFGINIAKEVDSQAANIEKIFTRAHRSKSMPFELLICLEYKLLVQHPEHDYTKFIPTIIHKFYSNDLLNKEFLIDWSNGELDEKLAGNNMYSKETDDKFLELCKDFVKFINNDDDSSDEESSEENDES